MRSLGVAVSLVVVFCLASAGCRVPNPLYGKGPEAGVSTGDAGDPAEDATTFDLARADVYLRDTRPGLDEGRDLFAPDLVKDVSQPDLAWDRAPVPDSQPDLVVAPDVARPDLGGLRDAGDDGGLVTCVEGASRFCPMASATAAADSCQVGSSTCRGGQWGICSPTRAGQSCGLGVCASDTSGCVSTVQHACVAVSSGLDVDGCDHGDEDCDGLKDEDCLSACVRVAPDGVDAQADGSASKPFGTIQAAVDWAAADATHSKRVCVASVEICSATQKFTYQEAPVIPAGVSVQGGYASKPWQSCANTELSQLALTSELGVRFVDAATSAESELSRFAITRKSDASLAAVSGVAVSGANTKVVLTSVFINDSPVAKATYGVRVSGGALVKIFRSSIASGNGSEVAMAVQAEDSAVELRENCDALTADNSCASACAPTASSSSALGFRGPTIKSSVANSRAEVISLTNVKSSSKLATSSVCGAAADSVVGVHIQGSTSGFMVSGNHIEAAEGSKDIDAVLVQGCVDENPRITANELIKAQAPSAAVRTHAIRSDAGCPFIDGNKKITVQPAPDGGEAYAIRCSGGGGCHILGNRLIQVEDTTNKATVAAILCEGTSACPLVAHNIEISGGAGQITNGIVLTDSDGVVNDNAKISGGCASTFSTGIQANASSTRLVGNTVVGSGCATKADGGVFRGIKVAGSTTREVSVEGNTIDAAGSGLCTGVGIDLDTAALAITMSGSYTSNKISAGSCATRVDFREAGLLRPRTLKDNTFVRGLLGTVPYQRDGRNLSTAAEINALSGTDSSGNVVN